MTSGVTTTMLSMKPSDEILTDLYLVQKCSYADIARRLGVTKTSVKRWLQAAGIPARDISTATSLAQLGRPISDAHKAALRKNAAIARSKITDESRKKQAASMRGKVPHNKGKSWTPEERVTHMAVRATDEYKRNLSASLSGEKNYMWKGGVTPESQKSIQGWEWRRRAAEVYERDGYLCRDCGCKCLNTRDSKLYPKRKIQAHHVVPRRHGGGDELENLVTLCMSCHHKRERGSSDALFA